MAEGSLTSEYEKLAQVNALIWAKVKGLQLRDGVYFSLDNMPYLADIVNCKKRVMHVKKGTQVCITTTKFIESVHACFYRKYKQNVLYMLPTVKAAQTLSDVSFSPILESNGWLKKMVSVNTKAIKTINKRSIVLVGAQPQAVGDSNEKDSVNLRSIPTDCVKRDEIDLMDAAMVDLSKQRLNYSDFRIEENFGSPTYPNYGIDLLYLQSDMGKWQIKCRHCGKYTCLVESFPNSIILDNGRWIRACIHCHKEIFVNDGQWIADYPDRPEAGFWVDGLISPKADLDGYMRRYHAAEGSKLCEFQRSILGIAAIESENQLKDTDVLARCSADQMQIYSSEETAMGVDVGQTMHVVIGVRTGTETYEIIYVGRVKDFGELHDLAKKMGVRSCVIDAYPDTHATRQFQKQESYKVYRCQYSENMTDLPEFNAETGMVKCNRNEMMDKVHDIVINGKVKLPRQSLEMKEFARQMTMTAKTIVNHPETGVPKPRWIKLGGGDDHFFHASLYFVLACMKQTPHKRGQQVKRFTTTINNFHI
jgi:hypothetical protein